MSLVSKPLQSYYRKAREGKAVLLDESLFAGFVVAMMIDIASESKPLQRSKLEDCLLAEEVSVATAPPVLDYVGVAIFVKGFPTAGEDGDSPYPLGVFYLDMPLDWVLDGDEDEDPSSTFLDANE
jgi:hypothetical protein